MEQIFISVFTIAYKALSEAEDAGSVEEDLQLASKLAGAAVRIFRRASGEQKALAGAPTADVKESSP
jgi:hypothetical protein